MNDTSTKSKRDFKTDNKNYNDIDSFISSRPVLKTYKKGDVVEVVVQSVHDSFVLVDLNSRSEGIIYKKELKIDKNTAEPKVGDKLLAYVIKSENQEGLVELSVKKTGSALKWYELEKAKESDSPISVKVIEVNTGGVLVEIFPGVRGFVPSSQLKSNRIYSSDISITKKEDASRLLQSKLTEMIGETLQVKIMEIDKEKGKIILSEKAVYSDINDINKRNQTLSSLKVGDILEGVVTGIAPFGLFVNAQGVEGLVHLSEISWDKVTNPGDFYQINQNVKVQVIGLGDNGRRVAYSIKRLVEDPWKELVKKYSVGQIVKGEVKSIANYGVFVKIEEGLNGLIHISELSTGLVKDPSTILNIGDIVKVMIISISYEDRHLGLSYKRVNLKTNKPTKTEVMEEVGLMQMKDLEKIISESNKSNK